MSTPTAPSFLAKIEKAQKFTSIAKYNAHMRIARQLIDQRIPDILSALEYYIKSNTDILTEQEKELFVSYYNAVVLNVVYETINNVFENSFPNNYPVIIDEIRDFVALHEDIYAYSGIDIEDMLDDVFDRNAFSYPYGFRPVDHLKINIDNIWKTRARNLKFGPFDEDTPVTLNIPPKTPTTPSPSASLKPPTKKPVPKSKPVAKSSPRPRPARKLVLSGSESDSSSEDEPPPTKKPQPVKSKPVAKSSPRLLPVRKLVLSGSESDSSSEDESPPTKKLPPNSKANSKISSAPMLSDRDEHTDNSLQLTLDEAADTFRLKLPAKNPVLKRTSAKPTKAQPTSDSDSDGNPERPDHFDSSHVAIPPSPSSSENESKMPPKLYTVTKISQDMRYAAILILENPLNNFISNDIDGGYVRAAKLATAYITTRIMTMSDIDTFRHGVIESLKNITNRITKLYFDVYHKKRRIQREIDGISLAIMRHIVTNKLA